MGNKEIRCRDCWWFREVSYISTGEGQCFAYGFLMKPNEIICCEFARGRNDG